MGVFSKVSDNIIEASHKERKRRFDENNGEDNRPSEAQGDPIPGENKTFHPNTALWSSNNQVVVTDIDISFGSMVWLMIKFSFATIPAAIFIFIIYVIGYAIITAIFKH